MVARPDDYRWSSFRYHSFGDDGYTLLDMDPMYSALADTDRGRQKAYKDFIALNQDKGVFDLIKKSISHDSILGLDGFINRLRKELALSKPRPRGRPQRKIIK